MPPKPYFPQTIFFSLQINFSLAALQSHFLASFMDVDDSTPLELDSKLTVLSGYHAFPINLPSSSMIKYLFIKALKNRSSNDPSSDSDHPDLRTLYVTNLAPHCTEKDLLAIFGTCGTIESIRYALILIVLLNCHEFD